jgi:thiamine-monophosphate kinase
MSRLMDIGEKAAVEDLIKLAGNCGGIGPGDDAAAVDLGDRYLVITTDMIAKHTHVPDIMTPRQVGWTVAAVNYSDIAAMGAIPLCFVVSMGFPKETDVAYVKDVARGIKECSEMVAADYVGGDTKECYEMALAGTAVGTVSKDGILLRKGAKPGDLLAMTGSAGLAGAGFEDLTLDIKHPRARKALLEPIPRVKEAAILSASGFVTSCMDTSDGLASSIHELSKASGVNFLLNWDSLPIPMDVFEISELKLVQVEEMVLYSGGDYQLLFTVERDKADELHQMLGKDFTVIGEVRASGPNVVRRSGQLLPLERRGFEHFKG